MPTIRKPRSLVTHKIEMVSVDLFKKHFELIIDLVGNSPGIYALYDEGELYYVGKSIDLKKRVRHHLKDRHKASWTHFSLYLVRNAEHIHEIESLIVRISSPSGNKLVPKGKSSGPMLKKLQNMVKRKQKEEYNKMFGIKSKAKLKKMKAVSSTFIGLVNKRTLMYRTYKNKDYKAMLTPAGKISLKGKLYSSPSSAAMTIIDRGSVNGWNFWYIKDLNGDWVQLDTLRKK
ncbi:MAG: GIY-YIG nuclease family protein [Proteobacteria bacterium]|nr:GIY-YIG nuclease family protein [Pseudomonadota bacterium]